jgi:Tol biopolymer transport system component
MQPRPLTSLLVLFIVAALIAPVSMAQATPPADALPPLAERPGLPRDPWEIPPMPAAARAQLGLPPVEAPAAPQYEPPFAPFTRLVYQSARNEHDWDVYGANGAGNGQVNLSSHPSNDIHPQLDRGGNRVAFASDRYGDYEIFVMPVTGAALPPRLTESPGADVYPAWAPDGTKIAFQSQRDGQPEVYVMNADGSGETRLTFNAGLDSQPAWSPDGQRIAFVRQVGNTTHLWVMNADGGNSHEIAALPFCENPAWSPDGQWIGFDADGDADGWMELWVAPGGGGQPVRLYKSGASTADLWMGSWSPDSTYILYTEVSYVQYQGQWYWLDGMLRTYNLPYRLPADTLPGSRADWRPSLASLDIQAPETRVLPLPAVSPSAFNIKYAFADPGVAGLARVELQISIDGGPWTAWRESFAPGGGADYYGGTGGQAIAFRSRGVDKAGNVEPWPAQADAVTRIESEPPVIHLQALPAYTQGESVELNWSMFDPGGSGVIGAELEVQDVATGEWQRENSGETAALFYGELGHTYRFRLRGLDKAGTWGEWPPDERAPQTTLYQWAATGQVTDNGGAPVEGAQITLSSPLLVPAQSDGAGRYTAYTAAGAYSHYFGVGKAGYGPLPTTPLFTAQVDQHLVVLPPADDVLQDGGFENGLGEWVAGGAVRPVVSGGESHSGSYAARLFPAMPAQSPPTQITKTPHPEDWIGLETAGDGGAHLLWRDANNTMYALSRPNRTWSVPPTPAPKLSWVTWGSMAQTADGTIWLAGEGYKYDQYPGAVVVSRKPGRDWSAPQLVPPSDVFLRGSPILKARADGGLVMAAREDTTLFVAEMSPGGGWSAGVNVAGGEWIERGPALALGPGNDIHVAWQDTSGGIRYACKTRGAWQQARLLIPGSHFSGAPQIAVSPAGDVSIVSSEPMEYVTGRCGSNFSTPVTLGKGLLYGIAVDKAGTVSVLGQKRMDARLIYYRKPAGGSWQAPEVLRGMLAPTAAMIAADDAGFVHLVWSGWLGEMTEYQGLYYARRGAAPHWEGPDRLGPEKLMLEGLGPSPFAVDAGDRVHVMWSEWDPETGAYDLYYNRRDSGVVPADTQTLEREFTVPAAATRPGLSFVYRFSGGADRARPSFLVTLKHAGGTATLFSRTEEALGWEHEWVELSPYAGQAVQLTFAMHQWGGLAPAWAVVDDVTVGSTHPDVWVSATAPVAAAPGSEYVLTLSYGNLGAVDAGDAQVTLQLPPAVTLVSTDLVPVSTGDELRWETGALPARSTAGTVRVRVRVPAGTPNGVLLSAAASITSSTPELEVANNTATAATSVGHRVYGPLLAR